MQVDIIFKIAGIGIVVAIINQILSKNGREDIATMVTLTGVIIVLMVVAEMISDFFVAVKTMFDLY